MSLFNPPEETFLDQKYEKKCIKNVMKYRKKGNNRTTAMIY